MHFLCRGSVLSFTIFSLSLASLIDKGHVDNLNKNVQDRIKANEIVVKVGPSMLSQINTDRARVEGKTGLSSLDDIADQYGVTNFIQRFPFAKTKDIYGEPINLRGWFKVRFSNAVDVENVVKIYKRIQGVVDAQVIGIHRFDVVTPNDPFYDPDMWYLNQGNDHDVDAPEAWDIAMGNSSIIVADLDSGFRYYHGDLGGLNASASNPENSRGNMWINETELNGTPGVDDDGNGYDDDWIGWDFVDGNPQSFPAAGEDYNVEDNDPRDHNGHGTHTIGTIGAITNNGYAVSSIAGGNGETAGLGNGVKVMGLRIGWTEDFPIIGEVGLIGMDFAANAFIYAADNGAQIASCSWGSSNSGGLEDALNYFLYGTTTPNIGVDPELRLVFKSAGNDNDEVSDYMLDRSDVIGVAATDQNDIKSDFSTYGTWVDISAPGSSIISTYHLNTDPDNDYVATLDGTSMATPCVASVAALMWSHNNALTPDQIEQMLYDTADDIESIPGNSAFIGKLGAGRVNAFAAVEQADLSLPIELVSFSAIAAFNKVILNWQTKSELNNLGFHVLRSNDKNGFYSEIAGFQENESLRGLGSSSFGKDYQYVDLNIEHNREYWYKIKDVDYNGVGAEHGPVSIYVNIENSDNINLAPDKFALRENYPNPFNPKTKFTVEIPELGNKSAGVEINIFDINGKKIKSIFKGNLASGIYTFEWNGTNEFGNQLPSGMYLYCLKTRNDNFARKMILMK